MGRRVRLCAPLRRDTRTRARPRARARVPLSRTHSIRPAEAETGRPLAGTERARALPFLRVPERAVRRPVARVQGDAGAGLVAGRVRPPACRASDPGAPLSGEPADWSVPGGLRPEPPRGGALLRNARRRLPTPAARLGSVRAPDRGVRGATAGRLGPLRATRLLRVPRLGAGPRGPARARRRHHT